MPRADAPLREVLVPSERAPDGPEEFDVPAPSVLVGDKVIVGLFVVVAAALLVLSLVPGWQTAHAVECTPNRTCTYEEGAAIGHAAAPVGAAWVMGDEGGREECCDACGRQGDCVAATFLDVNATGPSVNCIMYGRGQLERTPLPGASLCSLPSDGVWAAQDSLERQLETLLGAAAILTRFGGLALIYLLGKLLECVGYGGAGLAKSVLTPQQAGVVAAAVARAKREAAAEAAAVPEAAGWDAIAYWTTTYGDGAPSTWTEAREALGLSVRQAVWSCGSKLLLWHWAQPLSYFAVLGVYYCALADDGDERPDSQRTLGLYVAGREVLYVLSTLLALWLNPAYLLLELNPVLKPAAEGAGRSCSWSSGSSSSSPTSTARSPCSSSWRSRRPPRRWPSATGSPPPASSRARAGMRSWPSARRGAGRATRLGVAGRTALAARCRA